MQGLQRIIAFILFALWLPATLHSDLEAAGIYYAFGGHDHASLARAAGMSGSWFHLGFLTLAVLNLVAALQTMGVILALGLFLLPAATAYLWCDRFVAMLGLAAVCGMAGSCAGMLLSYHTGLASGPAIVLCLGAIFIASALGSPHYGLLATVRRARSERRTVRHTTE